MIKKILGLIIIGVGIINTTNAYNYLRTEINLPGSYINSGTEYFISNNGNFRSKYGKSLELTDGENKYTIFWNNGQLYLFGERQNYYQGHLVETIRKQGFLTKFCKFQGYNPNGCRQNLKTNIAEEFYNLTNVNFTILGLSLTQEGDSPGICFYNETNETTYCTAPLDQADLGNQILSGSLNIPNNTTDFKSYTQNKIYENSDETRTDKANQTIRINTPCPSIRLIMKSFGSNYNTGLCYNNNTFFNGTNFEQTEKEDIFTIFNDDYQNYTNRISIYRNNCTKANTTEACQRAFSGEYKKYSIISNATYSNVDEKNLRNYCDLGLNYDPNATTCVASGGVKEEYTNEEMIEYFINNGIVPTPSTTGENQNNVLNALNKCESGDRECYVNNRNFIDSLKNIYAKITGLFKERSGVNGIIPSYILRIAFLTILFTVIFKK